MTTQQKERIMPKLRLIASTGSVVLGALLILVLFLGQPSTRWASNPDFDFDPSLPAGPAAPWTAVASTGTVDEEDTARVQFAPRWRGGWLHRIAQLTTVSRSPVDLRYDVVQGTTVRWAENGARFYIMAQQTGETPKTYRYRVDGRRDPFESLVEKQSEPSRSGGPLAHFDLSTLTLSGIIWGELGRRAIIKAPGGKGYFVAIGTYMGRHGGQIVAIEDEQLIIKEKHRDIKGIIIDKTLTLPLRR